MPTDPLLPTLMRVLDRAETAAMSPVSAPDRDHLLALAQAIRPDHPLAHLEAAVDDELAHLAEDAPSASARVPKTPQSKGIIPALGWARPTSEAERDALKGRPAALRRTKGWKVSLASLMSFALGELLCVGLLHLFPGQPGSVLEVALRHNSLTLWFMVAPIALLLTAGCSSVAADVVDVQVRKARQVEVDEFLDDLPRPLTEYLALPACRAYLTAVLESGVPYLLKEDLKRLEAQVAIVHAERQRQAEEADRPRREAALRQNLRQRKEALRQRQVNARGRMAEVATLLASSPEPRT